MKARPANWKATLGTRMRNHGALRVCVVYEGTHDWRRAWMLLDHLHTAADVTFAVEWFEFDELPLFIEKASKSAGRADLVVVASSKQRPVPALVHRWLMSIRDHTGDQPAALIGLFSESDSGEAVCPWERLLQDIAIASGRDLFIRATDSRRPAELASETDASVQ